MWQAGWRKVPVPRQMGSADRVAAMSLICLKGGCVHSKADEVLIAYPPYKSSLGKIFSDLRHEISK